MIMLINLLLVVGVITERNTAAHQTTGDDVVAILPYYGEGPRRVLERAFLSFWAIPSANWENATREQRALVLRNCRFFPFFKKNHINISQPSH